MNDKIDKLLNLTEETHEHITQKREKWYIKALNIFEKLIIPILLAIIAYAANNASTQIAKSQLELAQQEASRRDNQHRDELKVKYIEIFLKDINSTDDVKKNNALSMLNIVDNELASSLVKIIEKNKNLSEQVKKKIQIIKQTARNTAIAYRTGKSGRWQTYEVCVSIPDGAVMDKETVRTRVVQGVGPGSWGNWAGPIRFDGKNIEQPTKVCRAFAHQIHDQDRVLEISVEYDIEKQGYRDRE
jgi:hypothetical protein